MKKSLSFHTNLINFKLFFYIILSVAILFFDNKFNFSKNIRETIDFIIEPLYVLADAPNNFFKNINNYFKSNSNLKVINSALESKLKYQAARLQELESLKLQNNRLRKLLDSDNINMSEKLSMAEIIRIELNPYNKEIVINKGKENKCYIGQVVVDENGLLGQISDTQDNFSVVTLISDPGHALLGTNSRTSKRLVISGSGDDNSLEGLYVPKSEDISIGDKILTSGLDSIFPEGKLIGKVIEVTNDEKEDFLIVKISPFANLSGNKEVILLWR